jgi:hypothetical protein
MVQGLISQSPDIQKVLAFEGAFEKLFNIVSQEGGVDGGAVAQGALSCVDSLLRFNRSNQVIFRTRSILLCDLLVCRVISEKQPCRHFCVPSYSFPQQSRMKILHRKSSHFSFGMTRNRRIRLL